MRIRYGVAALSAIGLVLAFGATRAQAQQEFKIGVVESVTGPFAQAAKDEQDGVMAWVKKRGLPGKKITFVTLDDETNPVESQNTFRKLASDPSINLIYDLVNSNSAMAIKSVASEMKVPLISSGAVETLGVPADPWLFKVAPGPTDMLVVLLQYAQKKGYTRMASMHSTSAFGKAEEAAIRQLAPKYGVTLVDVEEFADEETNFTPIVTRIKASNPQILYNGASGRPGILSYKAIKQLGLTMPYAVQQANISPSLFDAVGGAKNVDGMMTPMQMGAFGEAMGGDTARLYKELADTLGRAPVYSATFGYDVGLITEAAVPKSNGTRQGIRDAIESLKNVPGVNGPISYQPDNHTGQDYRSLLMAKLVNGLPQPAD